MESLQHHLPLLRHPCVVQAHHRRSFLCPGPWRRPLRGGRAPARASASLGDLVLAEAWARGLLERAEGMLYTVADAVVTAPARQAVEEAKQGSDWFSSMANDFQIVLKVLKDGLSALHVPYAYGFAIILLSVLVNAVMFPLTKKRVESVMAMRSLEPQVKAIENRYAGDKMQRLTSNYIASQEAERIISETARLYKLAGVSPFPGCLLTLSTILISIGFYRALSNVTDEGLLAEGFFWIPSLAGPTAIVAGQNGSGTFWLFPFVDGHPPLGWSDTLAYLVLPMLYAVSVYVSAEIMRPTQEIDPNQNNFQAPMKPTKFFLWSEACLTCLALSVPSGLVLYWFTSNVLMMAQQIWLQKLGGAKTLKEISDRTRDSVVSDISIEKQRPILETNSIRKVDPATEVSSQEKSSHVKQDSSGLRRGERFKQIKEQEAKKRQEKEAVRRRTSKEAGDMACTDNNETGVNIYAKNTLEAESSSVNVVKDSFKVDLPQVNDHQINQVSEEGKMNTSESRNSIDLQQNVSNEDTEEGNS